MPTREAMDIIDDSFVNYEVNTTPGMQYLNDMGLLMYTKFWFRIQRVILRQFRDNTARVLLQQTADKILVDMPDITGSLFPLNLGLQHINSPLSVAGKAVEWSAFNYAPDLF